MRQALTSLPSDILATLLSSRCRFIDEFSVSSSSLSTSDILIIRLEVVMAVWGRAGNVAGGATEAVVVPAAVGAAAAAAVAVVAAGGVELCCPSDGSLFTLFVRSADFVSYTKTKGLPS